MKIQMSKNGQYFLTLPKSIIEAMGWSKANSVFFEIMGKDKIKIEKVKNSGVE